MNTNLYKPIFISEDLRLLLQPIKNNSIVASLLLCKEHPAHSLTKNHIDYISIAHSDSSKLSYLTPDRMKKLDHSEYWSTSKRFSVNPGSFVRKIFNNISERDIEIFVTLFKNVTDKNKRKFEIVVGEDIRRYYHYLTYLEQASSIGASCMKYDGCQKYLDFYVNNPDQLKMIILFTNILEDGSDVEVKKILGRALLWNFDGKKIMDRIYTINDEEHSHFFKMWADENGFIYKNEQNWRNTIWFESKGEKFPSRISFTPKNWEFKKYPYLDTFKFLDISNGCFYNYLPENLSNIKTLCAPDGSVYNSDYLKMDEMEQIFYNCGELIFVRYLNLNVHNNKLHFSSIYDTYILKDHSKYLEDIEEYVFSIDMDHLNDYNAIEEKRRTLMESRSRYEATKFNMNVSGVSQSLFSGPPRRTFTRTRRVESNDYGAATDGTMAPISLTDLRSETDEQQPNPSAATGQSVEQDPTLENTENTRTQAEIDAFDNTINSRFINTASNLYRSMLDLI
jgi:hypothetical protein